MKVKILEEYRDLPQGAVAELPDDQAAAAITAGRAMNFDDYRPMVHGDAPPQSAWLTALDNKAVRSPDKNESVRTPDGQKVKTK